MRHIVPLIWEAVATDTANGAVLDREAYCQKFSAMRPELDRKVIETVVAEAISFHGRADGSPPPSRG